MVLTCTRCEGTGFLNSETLYSWLSEQDVYYIKAYIDEHPENEDFEAVTVCDCCGDGEDWHDVPGEHYNDDKQGKNGPYAYNGGLCECH